MMEAGWCFVGVETKSDKQVFLQSESLEHYLVLASESLL